MTTMGFLALAGAAILAATTAVTRLLAGGSASMRHLLWTVVLSMLVLAPLLELSGVHVQVPVPASWLAAGEASAVPTVSTVVGEPGPEESDAAPSSRSGRAAVGFGASGARAAVAEAPTRVWHAGAARDPAVSAEAGTEPLASATDPAPSRTRSSAAGVGVGRGTGVASAVSGDAAAGGSAGGFDGVVASFDPATALTVVWATGFLALLFGTLFSHVAARRLAVHGVQRPDPETARRFAELTLAAGMRRPVRLVVSPSIRVPATWGFLRPTIVLPPQHTRWSPETLERVLLHELAHVQRGDCWSYLVGEIARAIHWPNPLVWHALTRLRAESEHACDDHVLESGGAASEYAADLLDLVRSLRPDGGLPQAALAMARPSGLGRRVRAVLDPEQPRRRPGRGSVAGMGLAAVTACLAVTVVVPVATAQERPADPDAPPEPPAAMEPPAPPAVPDVPQPDSWAPRHDVGAPPAALEPPPEADRPTGSDSRALPRSSAVASLGGGARAGVVQVALPSLQSQEHCVFRGDGRRSTSINSDEDRIRIRWETDDCRVDIDIEGEVTFAVDDSGVSTMERGALFEIEERVGRERRRVRLEGMSGGAIERRWWVGGDEEAWGPDADSWLAGILPQLFRHTTINARARVRRMLDADGPEGVFAEVARIHSDHVSRTYLEILMEESDLTEREYARVIEVAGGIDSDHSKGELLLAVVQRAGMRPAFQEPMLRVADSIESDHQKTRVLEALLASELSVDQFDEILRVASRIDSDHNLGEVLTTVARRSDLSLAGRASFLAAVRSIDSDHTRGTVINAFLDEGAASDEEILSLLEMTEGMDSDHQRGEVLQRIAREHRLTGAQVSAFLASARRIDSDHQMQMTAQALMENPGFTGDDTGLVLDLAAQVDSDHSRAMILHDLIRTRDLTGTEVEALLRVASGIDSDHQASVTLVMLAEDEALDARGIEALLEAAGGVSSSHQRVQVLLAVARRYELDGARLTRYEELAASLGRHDQEQALRAIGRNRPRS